MLVSLSMRLTVPLRGSELQCPPSVEYPARMAKPRRIDGIGASVKRREDLRLLTGRGRYAEDWNAPDQAYAAFVRSPPAPADVASIAAKLALALDGVLGVFTGNDLVAGGVGPIPTLIAERGGGI